MRRLLAALAAVSLLGVVAAVRRRKRDPAPSTVTEIADGVLCIGPHGRTQTNVFLLRAGDASVLVDAGWVGDAQRILEAVRAALGPGFSPRSIVLTHVHPDHAGAAGALATTWGCPVFAHRAEVPIAGGDIGEMARVAGPLDRWLILPVLRAMGDRRRAGIVARSGLAGVVEPLPDDGSVPGLDGWTWLAMPGHTPGEIALLRTADRVVLTGDALLTLEVNTLAGALLGNQGLSGPPWYTTWDAEAAGASVRAIAGLEPAVVGPGYGHPLSGPGTAARLRAFAASDRSRAACPRSRIGRRRCRGRWRRGPRSSRRATAGRPTPPLPE